MKICGRIKMTHYIQRDRSERQPSFQKECTTEDKRIVTQNFS
jgi:hypothetical protein